VISLLTKAHFDYHVLTELNVFNKLGELLPIDISLNKLSQGKSFEWIQLLDKGTTAHSYTAKVVDPNTFETRDYAGSFSQSQINAVYH
jgi:hypothetical protein